MINFIEFLITFFQIVFLLLLSILTFFIGTYVEKRHLKSIEERESNLKKMPLYMDGNKNQLENIHRTEFVTGSVVIGADYFKTLLAAIKNFFGGRLTSLEGLLERGRREAILRLREAAKDANCIVNVRYETCVISEPRATQILKVEIFAYGTALYFK